MAKKPASDGMHIEYHNVNPKKEKAANCIYLDKKRICHCKDSKVYLAKCFIASYCPCKVIDESKTPSKKTPTPNPKAYSNDPNSPNYRAIKISKIDCSLPVGCLVVSKSFGKGYYRKFDIKTRRIYFEFEKGELKCFSYPEVFDQGFLTVSEEIKLCIKNDKKKARII